MKKISEKNKKETLEEGALEKVAIAFTNWIGSLQSLFVHTILFIGTFVLALMGVPLATVLLVLTTVVSLEAIYLAIFIQMSVNRNSAQLRAVEEDIDEIQENVEEISEDIDEIQENVEEISEDVEDIQEDTEEKEKEILLKKLEEKIASLIKEVEELKKK